LEGALLEIPWEVYYNTISLYEDVDASFNFIATLPPELPLHVPHLRALRLCHNQLGTLPASCRLLRHLRLLHLAHNRLRSLPSCLAHLPHLASLDLSYNYIRELPGQCWEKMPALTSLNLSHNHIGVLPDGLGLCPNLAVLVVVGNPLLHPPASVVAGGTPRLLQYLRGRCNSPQTRPAQPPPGVFRSAPFWARAFLLDSIVSLNKPS